MSLTVAPWLTLLLAVPVLWVGDWLVAHWRVIARYSIPAPVVGGLLVAAVVLGLRVGGWMDVRFDLGTAVRAWTWFVTAEPDWLAAPVKSVNLPFLAAFFGCVGLGASWELVRSAGRQVLVYLLVVTVLAVLQNFAGLLVARLLGVSPLLGLVCSSMSLTGGHATTLGFAAEFERAGLAGAQTIGMAAATFGLVAGALITGPLGSRLIGQNRLDRRGEGGFGEKDTHPAGWLQGLRNAGQFPGKLAMHLCLLAGCLKAGAWISHLLQRSGMTFPVFMGTMLAGVIGRHLLDRTKAGWFDPRLVQLLAASSLGVFLVVAMMSLNLHDLAIAAGPMLVILGAQILLMGAFAWWITFPAMGRDYDAAVMAAGHCGFGLGSTATAVAGMKSLVEIHGPSAKAFLIVPLVGGFLVDITNAVNLTVFINFFRS